MIYHVRTASKEYWLTGTPGLDIPAAYAAFQSKLGKGKTREKQLQQVMDHYDPEGVVSEENAFVACIKANLGLTERSVATCTIGG